MGFPLVAELPIFTTGADGLGVTALFCPLTVLLNALSPLSLTAVTM